MHKRKVLPPLLAEKLSALRASRGRDHTDEQLEDVLAALARLPANVIVRASYEINAAAGFEWRSYDRVRSSFRTPLPELPLLGRNPRYAWLFLFHASGFVRELALSYIDSPPLSPFFLAALAWRLNDWAEPVRRAAQRCIRRIQHLISPEVVAQTELYLLDRRLEWGRWHAELGVLDELLGRKDVLAALVEYLRIGAKGPLGKCLRDALRYPNIDAGLPKLAASAVQPLVRAIASQCLISGKARWVVGFEWVWIDKVYFRRTRVPKFETRDIERNVPVDDMIWEAVRDRSVVVRRAVADTLISARPHLRDENALIAHLAKDESAAVRSRADFLLRHPLPRQ